MKNSTDHYWQMRLESVKKTLEKNNFEAFVANNGPEANEIVQEQIMALDDVKSISWGGSKTFMSIGLYDAIKANSDLEILDIFDKGIPIEEYMEIRRKSLLVDLFITGTNAVTETGQLVNLDMLGNRVAAITFGPKYVVILVGRNKIVHDLDAAMFRVKNYAAPTNAMRLDMKTPCVSTSFCEECSSPDRICSTWTITEKSFPKGRVKVILINADLGL
jgi:L-lactate utilization protein LutB